MSDLTSISQLGTVAKIHHNTCTTFVMNPEFLMNPEFFSRFLSQKFHTLFVYDNMPKYGLYRFIQFYNFSHNFILKNYLLSLSILGHILLFLSLASSLIKKNIMFLIFYWKFKKICWKLNNLELLFSLDSLFQPCS